ncbi:endothelin-converting enzyme homolog [Lucilia sericata]|uniref:endothelin-converting enzyme homolog n=1 Tax=Lucilia sericata TaxID=13632 RepID=UPI0018A85FF2|nr:endothelin-converting enzyme homolog [Lucilia sericata]
MKSLYIKLIILIILQQFCWLTRSLKGPCEDFYEYACSNYSRENPDENYKEITQKLDYEMNKKLLEYISKQTYIPGKQTFCDKMLLYWESCKSETQRDLKKYFEDIRPGGQLSWPLLADTKRWLEANETFDFWSLLGNMQSYGLNNVLLKQEIERNREGMLHIWLAPAIADDEEGTLPDNKVLEVLLKTLGIEHTELIIQQLYNVDLKLKNMSARYDSSANHIRNISWTDIDILHPLFNVKLYLENLLGSEINNISVITIENPEYIIYFNRKYWSPKELKDLCNYLMLKFLYYLAKDSTTAFTPIACIKDLRRKFDLAVNFSYYHNFFQKEETKFIKALAKLNRQIKATMLKYFEKNFLKLNCEQIIFLETKLNEIKIIIGNLPADKSFYAVENFYKDISPLSKENYFKNHLLLLKHRFRNSLLYKQNQTHFIVSDNHMGAVSSPFYVPQQNMVVIPFGSLQLPLYHYNQTPLEQLSLLGFVLAHELTHAFDTTGLNFDQYGLPLDPPSDIMYHKNFTKALKCMQAQNFTESIDERIADLFAARVVYRIYYENYSHDKNPHWRKRFFMNMAQFFCGKDNIQFIDHDSDAQRLQEIVKNIRPFAKAYNCSETSLMYTKPKCRLY